MGPSGSRCSPRLPGHVRALANDPFPGSFEGSALKARLRRRSATERRSSPRLSISSIEIERLVASRHRRRVAPGALRRGASSPPPAPNADRLSWLCQVDVGNPDPQQMSRGDGRGGVGATGAVGLPFALLRVFRTLDIARCGARSRSGDPRRGRFASARPRRDHAAPGGLEPGTHWRVLRAPNRVLDATPTMTAPTCLARPGRPRGGARICDGGLRFRRRRIPSHRRVEVYIRVEDSRLPRSIGRSSGTSSSARRPSASPRLTRGMRSSLERRRSHELRIHVGVAHPRLRQDEAGGGGSSSGARNRERRCGPSTGRCASSSVPTSDTPVSRRSPSRRSWRARLRVRRDRESLLDAANSSHRRAEDSIASRCGRGSNKWRKCVDPYAPSRRRSRAQAALRPAGDELAGTRRPRRAARAPRTCSAPNLLASDRLDVVTTEFHYPRPIGSSSPAGRRRRDVPRATDAEAPSSRRSLARCSTACRTHAAPSFVGRALTPSSGFVGRSRTCSSAPCFRCLHWSLTPSARLGPLRARSR